MANTVIELRHSYVTGNVPASLANGEIAINTYDGKLFYRGGVSNTIQTIERYTGPSGLDTEVQFNDSGELGSSENFTFDKSTGILRTSNVTASNVTTETYIQFGDGTRQYTANSGSGGGGETQNVTILVFNTTANGTTSTYDLGFNPVSANAIFVTIDGIVQPETSYSVNTSTNTITFDVEPAVGENVRVVSFAETNPYIIEDQSIDPVKFSTSTNTYISTAASDAAIALAIALG